MVISFTSIEIGPEFIVNRRTKFRELLRDSAMKDSGEKIIGVHSSSWIGARSGWWENGINDPPTMSHDPAELCAILLVRRDAKLVG
jgi:hypothetical protein